MKKAGILLLVLLVWTSCKDGHKEQTGETERTEHQHEPVQTEKKSGSLSPHTETMAMIGDAHVHIDYSSPSVRNRIIFGGLVGYDAVWQAGAHNATWIEINKDLEFNGGILPAGKYGFFLIPRKDGEWTVIFNSRWEQHGKDEYDEAEDVLRLEVKPEESAETVESLTYEVKQTGENEGAILFNWETKKLELPFRVKQS